MKRHKINRKGKVNLRCEVCELDFTRSSNLKRHVEIIHNCDNKDTDLISPHCKKKYKRLSFLKEHMPKCKAELEPNPKKKEVKWSREKKRSIVEHITQRACEETLEIQHKVTIPSALDLDIFKSMMSTCEFELATQASTMLEDNYVSSVIDFNISAILPVSKELERSISACTSTPLDEVSFIIHISFYTYTFLCLTH